MKQSVIFKSVLFAMVTLPLLTACTDDSNTSVGNVSNELKINVGIATAQKPEGIPATSRVVNPTGATIYTWGSVEPYKSNPTGFASNESIGIFLRRASDEGPYGFVTWDTSDPQNPVAQISGPYDNLKYTSVGNYGSMQVWNYVTSPTRPTVLLPENVYGQICAYYPYDGTLTYNGNTYSKYASSPFVNGAPYTIDPDPSGNTTPGNPAVADKLLPGQGWLIDCSAGVDYMYCPAVGAVNGQFIDKSKPVVDIVMHHAQTCFRFKVSVPASFSGSASITRFKVYGGFAMKAYTDIWSSSTTAQSNYTVVMPEISPGQYATADTIEAKANASAVLKTISANTSYEAAYFCIPVNESVPTNLYIECDIDGHTYRATISSITLLREWIYEIPLMLTQGQLVVHEVTINPWTIDNSIPVTPLL